jgi:esterase
MRLHFQSYGQGEPLLILHGLFGSLENWRSISQHLAAYYHVFALDQRNHGRSPHSLEMDYRLMAGDVDEFLKAHALPNAHVLGHSMGGRTAMQFALSYPKSVRKLIVADIAPGETEPHHEYIFKALLALRLDEFQSRTEIEAALAPSIPDVALRRFLLKNLKRDASGHFYWQIGLGEIHGNYSRLGEAIGGARPFERPALFIRGERSDYLTPQDMHEIRKLFPQAALHTIPDAGHLLHVEKAEGFLDAVRKFLAWGGPPPS